MKTLVSAAFVLSTLVLTACAGSPTGPTTAPTQSQKAPTAVSPQPTPAPTPVPAPVPGGSLTLTPSSASMAMGQTMTFTASGADGHYAFVAGPAQAFTFREVGPNSIQVTRIGSQADYGWVTVDGYNGSFVEAKAIISLR